MKKSLLVLSLIVTLLLTSCTTTAPVEELDCLKYPTHVKCLTDDPEDPDDPVDPVDPVVEDNNFIDIYYLNDFHGAIMPGSNEIGLSGIGSYIAAQKELYPDNVVVLAGGDMLQGSALSNYYSGLSTIDLMDEIGFDAFTLGNHEFDWGLETVTQYFDEVEENGEADFPLLGANVFLEGTTTRPDYIDPYTMIEKDGVKIGIIGTMGYGLEYSIATSKILGYEFANPVPLISQYAEELRTIHNCDIVLWVGHDSGNVNDDIAALTGNSKIDGMFNAHSHSEYVNTFAGIPEIQSGSVGKFLGHVRINLDNDNNIISYKAENLSKYKSSLFSDEYAPVQTLIDQYTLETDSLFNSPIIDSSTYYNTSDLSSWLSKLVRIATDSDIAFQNNGGTRTSIDSGETITLGVLYEVWPFDNVIKTVYLPGSTINSILRNYTYDTDLSSFEDDTIYKVATNDYVFDKTENPFLNGTNPDNTGILLRDLVEDELILQSSVYSDFDITNDILTTVQTD